MSHRDDKTTIQPDDPRLTAFALGAMEAEEAAAFEALLAADPSARAEVEALRALAGDLEAGFADDSAETLDEARRTAVLAADGPRTHARKRRPVLWGAVAVAATVLIAVPVLMSMSPTVQERGRRTARSELHADGSAYAREGVEDRPDGGFPFGSSAEPSDTGAANDAGIFYGGPASGPQGSQPGGTPAPSAPPPPPPTSPSPVSPSPVSPSPISPVNLPPQPGPKPTPTPTTGLVQPQLGSGGGSAGFEARGGQGVTPQRPTMGVALEAGPKPATWRYEVNTGDALSNLAGKELGSLNRQRELLRLNGLLLDGRWNGWNAQVHGERYEHPGIDGFRQVTKRGGHTSTFSVDVDTASYTNVRRLLNAGQRPHPAAVRIEEFVNYFDYGYAPPAADAKQPFAQHIQVAACPWNPKHRLVRIALKGKVIERNERPASNLVFLVDVSGSMRDEDKLALLQSGLEMLVENLDARDRISIVTYASSASLALESTQGDQRDTILGVIRGLKAGGSTNGAGGIQLAYAEARKHFTKDGVNRVILCTDGDFNVGVSDGPGLTQLVQREAKSGVYLSVLGFGTGNLQDGKMEAYSNAGNGNYAYIDGLGEAKRVLVEQMEGTLITIAKDVKFQVWFNPKTVHAWRLLGYENRRLAARDFNDDTKDAGDIGAGHEVTALYELVPTGVSVPGAVDPNPFLQKDGGKDAGEAAPAKDDPAPAKRALFIWRLRWKQPDGDVSELLERNVFDDGKTFEQADRDFQWAAGVTAFGMCLRHSPHRGSASYALVEELAGPAKGDDPAGRRAEFLALVKKAAR